MKRNRSIVPSTVAGLTLAICLSASNAAGFCRGVTSTPPAGYDPSVSGCYGAQASGGFLDLYWTNLCVGYSLAKAASSQVTLAQATTVAAQAFAAWSHVACAGGGSPSITAVDDGPVDCAAVGYDETGPNQHAIVFRDDGWPYGDSSNTLGLTTITYDPTSGEILDADIEINSHDFALVTSASIPPGAYDLATVLTHEAGHFLGLAHSDQASAIMYAHYLPGMAAPTPDDSAGLCAIDTPGGARATSTGSVAGAACDPTPRNGFSSQCAVDAQGGVASSTGAGSSASTAGGCALAAGAGRAAGLGSNSLVLLVLALLALWRRARVGASSALTIAIGALCALTAGCAGDDTNPSVTSDAGVPATSIDATTAGFDAEVPVTVAIVRVANWSFDAPAVDFCLAPHGTTSFRGPLLASAAAAQDAGADAGSAGLPFPEVSAYLDVAPGQYDARVVVAGASDCLTGIGSDATNLPGLGRDAFTTIALIGDARPGGSSSLELVGFADDGNGSDASVELRFINAATSLSSADLGMGSLATAFKPLFVDVPFGHASAASNSAPDASTKIDANGYAAMKTLSLSTLSAHPSGQAVDTAVAFDVTAAAGSVLTLALIGPAPSAPLGDGGGAPSSRLLECVDNAGTLGLLGSCVVVSE